MGNVHIQNLKGEQFDTELLYWDQRTQRIYSDEFIRIEQPDRIITGHGFESNQQMTVYTIRKPEASSMLTRKLPQQTACRLIP